MYLRNIFTPSRVGGVDVDKEKHGFMLDIQQTFSFSAFQQPPFHMTKATKPVL